VHDMSGYLEHKFAMPGEERLLIAATRHETGTFGPENLDYHRQRSRLFHSLEEVDGVGSVAYDESVDAPDPRETGYALLDLAVGATAVASSLATVVATWVAVRPHRNRDTLPAVKLELPGKSLTLSHEISRKERRRLVDVFLRGG